MINKIINPISPKPAPRTGDSYPIVYMKSFLAQLTPTISAKRAIANNPITERIEKEKNEHLVDPLILTMY